MKSRKSFMAGILAGMAPPSPFQQSAYPALDGTDASRMRGDVERVGKQFSAVIDRENGQKTQPSSSRSTDR
jgi:hypothetical protein